MRHDPQFQVPTFVPEELYATYGAEARVQVMERRAQRPRQRRLAVGPAAANAASRAPAPAERLLVVLAAVLAAVGLGVCAWWWGSLAWATIAPIWVLLAMGAAVALLHVPVFAVRAWERLG